MAKKPRTIRQLVEPRLRDASRFWHEKKKAREAAAEKVQVGEFKNGKPKYKKMYRCAGCKDLFNVEDTAMDHIEPVIPVTGFIDWNTHIERLFVPASGYQCLCKENCHKNKSLAENEERTKNRRKKKKKT